MSETYILPVHKKCAAYLTIVCEQGYEEFVSEELRRIEGVIETQRTFGNYDLLVRLELPTIELLREVITFRIRKIGKIRSSTTLMCTKDI